MLKLFVILATLRQDEKGATAIEYGLLAAIIAVALVTVLGTVSTALEGTFESVAGGLGGS